MIESLEFLMRLITLVGAIETILWTAAGGVIIFIVWRLVKRLAGG